MKQRIYLTLCLIALVSLFCSTIASLSLYMSFHNQDKQEDLQSHCNDLAVAAAEIERLGGDVLGFLQDAADPSVRITLIRSDGFVVWDSKADSSRMENHSDRPEVRQAMDQRMGQDNRRSLTIDQDTYYCALRFGEEDLVLRLGRNQTNVVSTFQQILPLDLISCLILFFVCAFFSDQATNRIVEPMLEAVNQMDNLDPADFYDELTPFINTIRQQNDTIRAQLDSIRQDRDTITLILMNMQEGLVMLSREKRILTVNNSALAMLRRSDQQLEGENLLQLTDDSALIQSVEQALEGQSVSGYLLQDDSDRIYQYFSNPVYGSESRTEISGVILFLMDVTEQQRAQKSREEFSANVSHELKTPLTSISGFAELMASGMASSSDDVKMFSGLIRKESSRLLSLIDDIIRLSRIEANMEQLQEEVELLSLSQEECEHLLPAADQKGIRIVCDGEAAYVRGNRTMLREVVYNLCENAVKYNKNEGSVHVCVRKTKDTVVLSVKDTGIGIPKEYHDRIFERFYRVDKSRSKETGGTGLGLSIVKHIVQAHGGSLTIDSEPGQGSCICALFPLSETERNDLN